MSNRTTRHMMAFIVALAIVLFLIGLVLRLAVPAAAANIDPASQSAYGPQQLPNGFGTLPSYQRGEMTIWTGMKGSLRIDVTDYDEGWVIRVHDPMAGNGSPQDYIEGPLWSDKAALLEGMTLYDELEAGYSN